MTEVSGRLFLDNQENTMHLEGSCHCRKVTFTVESVEPVPFMRCYCSICRKTAGAGGYAINLGAAARSMKVTGNLPLVSSSSPILTCCSKS